ncbi:MAG: transposase, partial [Verrucomicrobiota bacterium]
MPRRSVSWIKTRCCYHVTQRCQERRYLLRFKKDRRQYLRRLREATDRHAVSVLNYMVTSNHVHLLLAADKAAHVSTVMQYVSGSIAQDYNRRKERQGSFWSGRYRPTLIKLMGCGSWELFRDWYGRTLEQQCCPNSHPRQPLWTDAAAVGDEAWIEDLAGTLPRSWRRIEYVPASEDPIGGIGEDQGTYVMHVSKR